MPESKVGRVMIKLGRGIDYILVGNTKVRLLKASGPRAERRFRPYTNNQYAIQIESTEPVTRIYKKEYQRNN